METKKEQAREVSCSVRVQTDDHSGTNTVHAVRDEPRPVAQTHGCAERCISCFFSCVFFLVELGKMNERVQRETKKTHAVA